MKTLELNQMENVEAGNNCSNATNTIMTGSATTWVAASLFVASTGGLGLWVVAGAFIAAAYANCEGAFGGY